MRLLIAITVASLLLPGLALAQDMTGTNEPVFTVGVSFHAVSTPLSKPGNNFRNFGFKLGIELPWNKRGNLRQSVEAGYYFNRFNGRSLYVHSDFAYRPGIAEGLRVNIHLGPGLAYLLRPSQGMKIENGKWMATTSPRFFPQVHASISLSYDDLRVSNPLASPFVQYELMGIIGYNTGIPVFPNSFIHVGSKFKF
ncbi:MAG: hypothetical protein AB7K37_01995 [Cyclobacteriaceae bacterium]